MKENTERRIRQWTVPGADREEYERADGTRFVRERRVDRYGVEGEWRAISDTALPPPPLEPLPEALPAPRPLRVRRRPQIDIALADVSEVFSAIDDALVSVRALAKGEVRATLERQLENQRLCLEEVVGEVAQTLREQRECAREDAWDAARDERFLEARRGGE